MHHESKPPESNSFTEIQPQPVVPGKQPAHSGLHDLLSIVGVLVSAIILAYGLITFVFQSYQVDGPSMQTTLENGDHLVVWKLSKTIANVTGNEYIPKRGDIVILDATLDGHPEQLVKRIIALPGDRIVVKDSVVTVYNSDHPNGFNPDKTLPYGKVISTTPGNSNVTLKAGQVFVMGDHRDNSRDSRDFGPVESEQLVGKLVVRVLPLNTFMRF